MDPGKQALVMERFCVMRLGRTMGRTMGRSAGTGLWESRVSNDDFQMVIRQSHLRPGG